MGTNNPRPSIRPNRIPRRAADVVGVHRTNCPNCCAVITGPICEYCGTIFERDYDNGERVIPIYIGQNEIDKAVVRAFDRFHYVAHNIGNPCKEVNSPKLPTKEER